MEPIFLPQLAKAWQQTETQSIQTHFPDLLTLTPVQGTLSVVHGGNYLQVSAVAETIVTLTCDRCLCQYNHRLSIQPSELIWLTASEEPPTDLEGEDDDLLEVVPSQGYFDPGDWLYQQLCLALPQQQICDPACKGIVLKSGPEKSTGLDQRWAGLAELRRQLES